MSKRARLAVGKGTTVLAVRLAKTLVPMAVVASVRIGQTVPEEAIVVLDVRMMNLEPHARHMDRIDMRWETSMRVKNVLANVMDASNDLPAIFGCFLQITIAKVGLVDLANARWLLSTTHRNADQAEPRNRSRRRSGGVG